ncbi:MAG: hypothetical protein IKU10_03325, partial [Clostridia bacterium]|nr:hypothetical protein [Clostridia bacterium]
ALWLCLLLVVFTWAWVIRNWTPSIEQENLQINKSGALVISLMGDDNYDTVSLNKVVGIDSFIFKQVSSQDGQSFMWLDFLTTLDDQPARYSKVTDAQKENYIETQFALKLDDTLTTDRYVFIHPESFLSDTTDVHVSDAIRIALDYTVTEADGTETNHVYILGNTPEGQDVDYSTSAVLADADGKEQDDPTAVSQQKVYSFNYFNGGRTTAFDSANPANPENYNFTPDPNKMLLTIKPGELKWITLRIWLEGADENCVNEIAGQYFDLNLKFDSISVPQ